MQAAYHAVQRSATFPACRLRPPSPSLGQCRRGTCRIRPKPVLYYRTRAKYAYSALVHSCSICLANAGALPECRRLALAHILTVGNGLGGDITGRPAVSRRRPGNLKHPRKMGREPRCTRGRIVAQRVLMARVQPAAHTMTVSFHGRTPIRGTELDLQPCLVRARGIWHGVCYLAC